MNVIKVSRGLSTLYINANSIQDFYYDPGEDKTYLKESGNSIEIKGNHVPAILACFDNCIHVEPGWPYYKTELQG